MITRIVTEGLRDYFEANAPAELADVTAWEVEESSDDKTYPMVAIEATGAQEHEVLLGVYDISLNVTLRTIPEDTTEAAHKSLADALYMLAGDTPPIITALDGKANLKCWDVRVSGMSHEPGDGFRNTVIELKTVAAGQ